MHWAFAVLHDCAQLAIPQNWNRLKCWIYASYVCKYLHNVLIDAIERRCLNLGIALKAINYEIAHKCALI